MHILFAYIKFLFRSTNQHGVHSPFVYDLVTKCFYDRKKYKAYKTLKQFRSAVLQDHRMIQVSDFGAGSREFKSKRRKVSEIAKTAGIPPKRARLLNRLVRHLKVDKALELGTSVGLGTAALAAGNDLEITTIEGCPETAKVAAEKLQKFHFEQVNQVTGKFEEVLERHQARANGVAVGASAITEHSQNSTSYLNEPPKIKYSLIYIDGNHQKEATLYSFRKLLPHIHNDSVMIFDDIHWSREMEDAWEEIKKHPQVKVSIDTFQWGLVFFRREQEKEHFMIRV